MLDKICFDWFNEKEFLRIYFNEIDFLDLEIHSIKKGKHKRLYEDMRDPFSLILKGDKSIFFNQGYYNFEHNSTGVVELYMVPILGPVKNGNFYYYEISFS